MVRFNVRNVLTMEIFRQKGSDMEEKHQTLKELPVSERPYEKCEKNGTAMLSDAELLAVILRSGTKDQTAIDLATKVLSIDPFYEGILGICHTSREELQKIPGIGKVKAMQILCIAELSKRLASAKVEDKISFHSPVSIADYYMERMRHLSREEMILIFFNGNSILSVPIYDISTKGLYDISSFSFLFALCTKKILYIFSIVISCLTAVYGLTIDKYIVPSIIL